MMCDRSRMHVDFQWRTRQIAVTTVSRRSHHPTTPNGVR